MLRREKVAPGGMVFYALNRGVGRSTIFFGQRDYEAFEKSIEEMLRFYSMRILPEIRPPS